MPKRPATGPTRAILLTDLLDIGGAETQLVALLRAFDPAEVESELVVLRKEGGLVSQLSIPPKLWPMRAPFDPAPLFRLKQLAEAQATEVILTTHVWSLLYASMLRAVMGTRSPAVVATVHGYRRPAASPMLEPLWKASLRAADAVIAVSRAQADWLLEHYRVARERVRVLPNAIEPERFVPRTWSEAEEADRIILCVARLVSEKDHATLLEAFRLLVDRGRETYRLVLVGDGPRRSALEQQAADIQARSARASIELAGTVSDTREWLARADLVVLSSRHESQGIVLLEAMAAGLPVVATQVGGIPDMVVDGETGLLVPPAIPSALAAAIAAILEDRASSAAMGRAGRRRVEQHFSLRARAANIGTIFRELAARSDRG